MIPALLLALLVAGSSIAAPGSTSRVVSTQLRTEGVGIVPGPRGEQTLLCSTAGAHLVRFDSGGAIRSTRMGISPDRIEALSISGAADGAIVLAGRGAIGDGSGPAFFWIQKLDPDGQPMWGWRFPTTHESPSAAAAITPQGDVILGGVDPDRKPVLVRFSPTGERIWHRRYMIAGSSGFGAVAITPKGEILLAITLDNAPALLRLDPRGHPEWLRSWSIGATVTSLSVAPDGGIALGGQGFARSGDFVLRLDAGGSEMWARATDQDDSTASCSVGFDSLGRLHTAALRLPTPSSPLELAITRFRDDGGVPWQTALPAADSAGSPGPVSPASFLGLPGGAMVLVASRFGRSSQAGAWILQVGDDGTLAGDCPTPSHQPTLWTDVRVSGILRTHPTLDPDEPARGTPLTLDWRHVDARVAPSCPPAPSPTAPSARPLRAPDRLLGAETAASASVAEEAGSRLALEDFAGLEADFERHRTGRTRFPSGRPVVSAFVEGLLPKAPTLACLGTEGWLRKVSDWMRLFPASRIAPVVLARGLESFAWRERGVGFADTVPLEAAHRFSDLATASWETLEAIDPRLTDHPEYWLARLRVARALSSPRDERENSFACGLAADPESRSLASEYAFHFSPQWGGRPEDLERLARRMAARTKRGLGDAFYFWLAMEAQPSIDPFGVCGFDWGRVRRGIFDARSRFPGSRESMDAALGFARACADRRAAREILAWDPPATEAWRADPESPLGRTVRWASEEPETPWLRALESTVADGWLQERPGHEPPRRFDAVRHSLSPLLLELREVPGVPTGREPLVAFVARRPGQAPRVISMSNLAVDGRRPTSRISARVACGGNPAAVALEVVDAAPGGNATIFRLSAGDERLEAGILESTLEPPDPSGVFFVIGRPERTGRSCRPRLVVARWTGGLWNAVGPFDLRLSASARLADFVGAPVVDDRGRLVGVVTAPSEVAAAEGEQTWRCEPADPYLVVASGAAAPPPVAPVAEGSSVEAGFPDGESWPLPSAWRSSIVRDRLVGIDGRRRDGALGFVVRSPKGSLLAIVSAAALVDLTPAEDLAVEDVTRLVRHWELVPQDEPASIWRATAILRPANRRILPPNDFIVLEFEAPAGSRPVPLPTTPHPPEIPDAGLAVAILKIDPGRSSAQPRFLPALAAMSTPASVAISLGEPQSASALRGAPILDRDGRVFGIVAGTIPVPRALEAIDPTPDVTERLWVGAVAAMLAESSDRIPLPSAASRP